MSSSLFSQLPLCAVLLWDGRGWVVVGCHHGGISILCCSVIHIHPYQSHRVPEAQYPSRDMHSVNCAGSASYTVELSETDVMVI